MYLFRKPPDHGYIKNELKRQGLEEEVAVVETGCHGLCALGPIMIVYPDATFIQWYSPETSLRSYPNIS